MKSKATLPTLLLAGLCTLASGFISPVFAQDHPVEEARFKAPEDAYRVYLLGDIGRTDVARADDRVLDALTHQIDSTHERSSVVFLGDNLYCCGLPDSGHVSRSKSERRLSEILEAVRHVGHKIVFVPGNHDWNNSRPGGLQAVKRQARWVESYFADDKKVKFAPKPGYSGPAKIKLTDDVRLIAVDTEWWLTDHEKAFGDGEDFSVDVAQDLFFELDRTIRENAKKDLLVVGHHPIFSYGMHAGYHPSSRHFKPPILGSLFILYARTAAFSRQDLLHPKYKKMRNAFSSIFSRHENLIYASGHDHSLQHIEVGPSHAANHYVVSGSGSQTSHVSRRAGAAFAEDRKGYATVDYFDNGDIVLTFWSPGEDDLEALYVNTLRHGRQAVEPDEEVEIDTTLSFADSSVTVPANPAYSAGPLKRFFWGSQRRSAWAKPVAVPLLDLGTEKGGLSPTKRGGGMQTVSLRLESKTGEEYVVRMVDKDPSGTVPANLQGTVATDIVQDQIASIHPYGALVVPSLAEKAEILHPKPKLLYIPDDPRLGPFRQTFANRLALFEQRPKGDMSDSPEFGNSKKIVGAADLYEKVTEDNDHRVDAKAFAKVRLFDMLLSDWDRHRDQWRWASFKDKETDITWYRPIGRDRDWAFNRMNGMLPSIYSNIDSRFQDFTDKYGNLKGLSGNGHEQDRRFTAELSREDWQEAALSLQSSFTKSDVRDAFNQLPAELAVVQGDEFTDIFMNRLESLDDIANEYYELMARLPDVVGSDKHEQFVVDCSRDNCKLDVFKTSKKGKVRRTILSRNFLSSETKQLRLFGLGGNDRFVLKGVRSRVDIIVIGGPGDDEVIDERTSGKSVRVYDDPNGMTVEDRGNLKLRLSDDPSNNVYDSFDYKHSARLPQFYFGRNKDDGIFIGGGIKSIQHGFRKNPYKSTRTVVGNFAAATGAYNLKYDSHHIGVFGPWDVGLSAHLFSPNNIRNYFGLGNETENTDADRKFYQARLANFAAIPFIERRNDVGVSFKFGAGLSFTSVDEDTLRSVVQVPGISASTFDDQRFGQLDASLSFSQLDHPNNPKNGAAWTSAITTNVGLSSSAENHSILSTDLRAYISPSSSPQVTLALRAGAEHNFGSFPFYAARTIGGKDNLRGHRSTRFAGRSSAYQSAELRAELFEFSTYVAIGTFGLLGFVDNARVWTDGESSNIWHQGYGGGAWTNLFDMIVISGWAGFSEDDRTFTLKFGFQY